ncbi:MAG: 16S rRNA processing protein RimM [Chloroflexi bacterium]|nr:16S rRNA processing protein RimM [Chloroflexota bacterium]
MTDQVGSQRVENAPERLIVGQVVAPFGVKGELKVNILTEFPERFRKMEQLLLAPFDSLPAHLAPSASLDPKTVRSFQSHAEGSVPRSPTAFRPPSTATPFEIESTQLHKGQLLLKLQGVNDADAAAALRGYWVLVPLEQARKLPRGSYYLYQIVGLEVHTTEGNHLGKIADVITTSANDVYVVQGPGVTDPTGELLVPGIKAIVKRIELKRGRVIIAPPEDWA